MNIPLPSRKWCIYLMLIVLAAVTFPVPAKAELLPDLYLQTDLILTARADPYYFTHIYVEKNARLTIEPGVEVVLDSQAHVVIEGELFALGTKEMPIIFKGNSPQGWREFLVASRRASVVHNVRFEGNQYGIILAAKNIDVQGVTLVGGNETSNTLTIESHSSEPVNQEIKDIRLITSAPGGNGFLKVLGIFKTITLSEIDVVDLEPFKTVALDQVGIDIAGTYTNLVTHGIRFPYSCVGRRHTLEAHVQVQILPDAVTCIKDVTLPVVFVPGYAASFNLAQFVKPSDGTVATKGWRFFHSFNQDYFDLFSTLEREGIPYEIAYYDWRLPADTIAKEYLKPLIDKTKSKYHVQAVNIISHSFGGIVSRSYIQGDSYAGDVRELVEAGTPNQGLARAYSAWEAGVLPLVWSPMHFLSRYYVFRDKLKLAEVDAIHKYFPSVGNLMPTYAAVSEDGVLRDPQRYVYANTFLLGLNATISRLFSRVPVLAVASTSEPTQTVLRVGHSTSSSLWPDGMPLKIQPQFSKDGDGTTPLISASLTGMHTVTVVADHATLFRNSISYIEKELYPSKTFQYVPQLDSYPRKVHSFVFDCPVDVTITLPTGEKRSSTVSDGVGESLGEVSATPELLVMLMPEVEGEYGLEITARASTEVRSWVDQGESMTYTLQKDETATLRYSSKDGLERFFSPSPIPPLINTMATSITLGPQLVLPTSPTSVAGLVLKVTRRFVSTLSPAPSLPAERILQLASLQAKLTAPASTGLTLKALISFSELSNPSPGVRIQTKQTPATPVRQDFRKWYLLIGIITILISLIFAHCLQYRNMRQ